MPPPADRVKEVFDQAAEHDDRAARAALLERECAGDPSLRDRVEALLRAHDAAGSFLIHPAVSAREESMPETADGAREAPARGTILAGRYKLLERIGEGGMGTVWMAEQIEPVKRRVAVKLIRPGMDSSQILSRLEAERQALALMDHPNIAKVLDGGAAADGRPFLVMELVKGVPITRYCDEHALSLQHRLSLLIDICQAIQHAHQKGVIHRDLKPSNVLVAPYDGKPVVKVIDFGVAKATGQALTERTLFTAFGAVVGTPEYMSPEQAELNNRDIDTRSDVYSLGVLLYELLTGSTPLTRERVKQSALLDVLRLVREEEPPRPSTRLSTTAELPSVSAVRGVEASRLPREVRGELDWIVMRALEKDRSRRYQTAIDLAADVQRYLAGEPVQAVPPSTSYRLRKFARRNRGSVTAAGVVGMALLLAVGGIGWAVRDRAARQADAAQAKATRQARVAQEVEVAIQEANTACQRALTQTTAPQKWDAALAGGMSALARADGFAAQDPDALVPALHDRFVAAHTALAAAEADRRFATRFEAIRFAQADIDVRQSEFVHGRTLPALAAALRDCYGLKIGLAPPADAAAVIRRRPASVRDLLLAALEYAQARMVEEGGPATMAHWLVAVVARADDDPWRRRARAAVAAADWTGLQALAGDPAAARQPVALLVALASRMPWGSSPKIAFLRQARHAHPADFWLNHELAVALHYGSLNPRPAEAARYYTVSLAVRPDSPREWVDLGRALGLAGDLDREVAAYREALRLAKDYAVAHVALGSALHRQGRVDEAAAEYRTAIRLRSIQPDAYLKLADILAHNKKDPDGAAAILRQAIQYVPKTAPYFILLGQSFQDLGKQEEAIAYFRQGAAAYRKAIDLHPKSPVTAAQINGLAWLLATCPQPAVRNTAEAVRLAKMVVKSNPLDALFWNTLGVAQYRAGDSRAAIRALTKSTAIMGTNAFDDFFLAMAHWKLGQEAEARACYRRAIEWMEKKAPKNKELRRFRTEADGLLGRSGKQLPARPGP